MKNCFCFTSIFAFVLLYITALAQPDSVRVDLNSPYGTVYTHLYFLQPDSYYPEKAAQVFQIDDPQRARDLAIMLKQYLDATGLFVDLDAIPRENNYVHGEGVGALETLRG